MRKCLKSRFFAVLMCFLVLAAVLVVPISAADPPVPSIPDIPVYQDPVDWSDYPGSNLLRFPYYEPVSSSTVNGITYTLSSDGAVVVNGRNGSGGNSNCFVALNTTYLEPGVYSISGGVNGIGVRAGVKVNGVENYYYDTSFTVPAGATVSIIITVPPNNVTYTDQLIYPMLNKGAVAYPYQPYIPYWIQQAYGDGWDEAYVQGFNSAFDSQLNMPPGIFNNSALTVEVDFCDMNYDVLASAEVVRSGVDLSSYSYSLSDVLSAIHGYSGFYVFVVVRFTFSDPWSFNDYDLALNASDAYIPSLRLFSDPPGNAQVAELDFVGGGPNYYKQVVSRFWESGRDYNVKSFDFSWAAADVPAAGTNISFVVSTQLYDTGYTNGYNKGFTDGSVFNNEAAYNEGVKIGYDRGYIVGREDGLATADNGSFLALFTALIDAPVSVFQSLLNFEILGYNMASFVTSLLTLGLVLFVVKKFI